MNHHEKTAAQLLATATQLLATAQKLLAKPTPPAPKPHRMRTQGPRLTQAEAAEAFAKIRAELATL
jgi:hypothetical protein